MRNSQGLSLIDFNKGTSAFLLTTVVIFLLILEGLTFGALILSKPTKELRDLVKIPGFVVLIPRSSNLPQGQDPLSLLGHVLSYSDDVIYHRKIALEDYNVLLPYLLKSDEFSGGEGDLVHVRTMPGDKADLKNLVADVKGLFPKSALMAAPHFFQDKIRRLRELEVACLGAAVFILLGIWMFTGVMVNHVFKQHYQNAQILAYLGASRGHIRNLFLRFFQSCLIKGISISLVVLALLLILGYTFYGSDISFKLSPFALASTFGFNVMGIIFLTCLGLYLIINRYLNSLA